MNDIEALEATLDHVAPDKEPWQAGRAAYIEAIAEGSSTEQALYNALDAAAPDQEAWFRGRNVLVAYGKLELKGPAPFGIRTAITNGWQKGRTAAQSGRDTIGSLLKRRNHE